MSNMFSPDKLNAALDILKHDIPLAIWETFYVTLVSTLFAFIIGLPQLSYDFFAFLPDFQQCFVLDMRFYHIPRLSVRLLSLRSDFQLKAQKLGAMALQIYDF